MPTYCYKNETEQIELVMTCEEKASRETLEGDERVIIIDKKRYVRDYEREIKGVGVPPTKGWPHHSISTGVLPTQVAEAEAYAANVLGVPTQYDKRTGAEIWKDRSHRRQLNRARGMIDRDGGYSD